VSVAAASWVLFGFAQLTEMLLNCLFLVGVGCPSLLETVSAVGTVRDPLRFGELNQSIHICRGWGDWFLFVLT
jgi:hypothetical protein